MGSHPLLELGERPREPRRAGRPPDAEERGGGLRVEVEHDPQREHLALAGGERAERLLELRREPGSTGTSSKRAAARRTAPRAGAAALSARKWSSATFRPIRQSQVRSDARFGSKRRQARSAFSKVSAARSSATDASAVSMSVR